jgi:hypothetical protein
MTSAINPPMRALAYDPVTDHFWTANFSSNIVEFDRNGTAINTYANTYSVYGMAWDDVSDDGPWLWVFSQDGVPALQVSQFDPVAGIYTGLIFYAIDHDGANDDIAGGACFTTEWDPSLGIFFGQVQGNTGTSSADLVQGYEITPYSNWLIIDPMSGILTPAQNTDLNIMIDLRGPSIVNDTTYQASIGVENNSPDTPVIPVTVNVGATGTDDEVVPFRFALHQNYPNPFNAKTSINYTLDVQSEVKVEVYNLLGQKVETLTEGLKPAGNHNLVWDASEVASGIYYYKLTAGDRVEIKSMTLMK